jgi:hypothetical protein
MNRTELPHVEFGDAITITFLGGRSMFGTFQRVYEPENGDSLLTVRHAGNVQSFGLATLRRVEVMV